MAPGEELLPDARRFACLEAVSDQGARFADRRPCADTRRGARDAVVAAADLLPGPTRLAVHRALAIIHWEWALACDQSGEDARDCYTLVDRILRHLLPNQAFWDAFAQEHDISDEHIEDVRRDVIGHVLEHRLECSKACFLAGDLDACRFHVQCLAGWTDQPPPLSADSHAPWADEPPPLARSIQSRADGMFNTWISDFLRRAAEQRRNPEALERLRDEFSHDYQGAIAVVRRPLDVFPTNLRLLSFAVKQYTEMAHELGLARKLDEARAVIGDGCELAQRLAESHLKPSDGVHPDNQTVCLALQLAYNLETDLQREMYYLEQCRHWGGNAEQIEFQIIRQRARQALEEGRFAEALQILDDLDATDAGRDDIRQLRAGAYFRRGISAVEEGQRIAEELMASPARLFEAVQSPDGRAGERLAAVEESYRRGLQDLRQATEMEPGVDVIRKNMETVEELLAEGRFHLILRTSHRVLEEEIEASYADLVAVTATIPPDSELAAIAQSMSVAAQFRLGVSAGNNRDFEQAERWFQQATRMEPDNEAVSRQFSHLYVVWAQSLVAACIEMLEPLQESPERLLEVASNGFRAIQKQIRPHRTRMEKLLDRARAVAPPDAREEIEEAASDMSDVSDINVTVLLGGAQKVLENEQAEYYLGFGEALRRVPSDSRGAEMARHMAAACYLRAGVQAANDEQFKRAVEHLEQAARLDPEADAIRGQLEVASQLAREEGTIRDFRRAQEAFESDNFDEALQLCKGIPKSFSHIEDVRKFMALLCHKLSEQALKRENLTEALRHAKQATQYDSTEPALQENVRQMEEFQAGGGFAAKLTSSRHNEGIQKANNVVKMLDTVSHGQPLPREVGEFMLAELEKALEMTDHNPDIARLRDQLRDALRR